MAKKKKWPYKFISQGQMEEYKKLTKLELVEVLTEKNGHLKLAEKAKKGNDYLKEMVAEIREFREQNIPDGLIELKEEIKAMEEKRDEKITDSLDEKKEILGGFNDAINANKEHVSVLLSLLPKTN